MLFKHLDIDKAERENGNTETREKIVEILTLFEIKKLKYLPYIIDQVNVNKVYKMLSNPVLFTKPNPTKPNH